MGTKRDQSERHLQPRTVSVVFDPDGGEHPCYLLSHPVDDAGNPFLFWCAGMTHRSIEWLVDRIWTTWYEPAEPTGEFDELRAAEARIP